MQKGVIVSINRSRGYGFIESDHGAKIFFHQRWLRDIRFRDLSIGDMVVFNIDQGPRGPRAQNMNLADKAAANQTTELEGRAGLLSG
jgi:CspA family cold shock protein